MLERAITKRCYDTGKIEAKVFVRQEPKEGVPDELSENERQYRLSSYAKGFPFMEWTEKIVGASKGVEQPSG